MSNFKIISADDHVEEPRDTWQSRVPAKLRDRAPKVERVEGGDAWTVDGKVVTKMGLQVQAGKKFEEYKLAGETFETIRPGSYDPHERLKDMDIDGLEAQVLYPNSVFGYLRSTTWSCSSPVSAPATTSWPSSAASIPAA